MISEVGVPEPQDGQEDRSSGGKLLIIMLVTAVVGAIIMFRLGVSALGVSGQAMELNKLLKRQSTTCSDRSMSEECRKIKESIKKLEEKMASAQEKPGPEDTAKVNP